MHQQLHEHLPDDAYIGSNTSSLLCSPLAEASGRADRFFCLNFNDPRHSKLVELMGCELTAAATLSFAASGDERDKPPQFLVDMVERGETGTQAGKGFHQYPNPRFSQADFLN